MMPEKLKAIERAKNGFRALASYYETDSSSVPDRQKLLRFYLAMADLAQTIDDIASARLSSAPPPVRTVHSCPLNISTFKKKILESPNLTDAEKVKVLKEIEE